MTLTITVSEPLAVKLQSEAESRQMSVEQFALEVLGQAVQTNDWTPTNRRRLALIRKQFALGLTEDEGEELRELQRQADRHLEALDSQMMNDVAEMEKAGAEALDGSTH
jgi:hypothetical protein